VAAEAAGAEAEPEQSAGLESQKIDGSLFSAPLKARFGPVVRFPGSAELAPRPSGSCGPPSVTLRRFAAMMKPLVGEALRDFYPEVF